MAYWAMSVAYCNTLSRCAKDGYQHYSLIFVFETNKLYFFETNPHHHGRFPETLADCLRVIHICTKSMFSLSSESSLQSLNFRECAHRHKFSELKTLRVCEGEFDLDLRTVFACCSRWLPWQCKFATQRSALCHFDIWCNYAKQIPLPLWEFRGVPQFFMVEKHLSSFDGNYDHNAYFRPHLWGGYCILAFRTVTIGNTLLKAMHWSAALISRPIWIGRSITSFLDGKGGQFEEIDGAGWTAGA